MPNADTFVIDRAEEVKGFLARSAGKRGYQLRLRQDHCSLREPAYRHLAIRVPFGAHQRVPCRHLKRANRVRAGGLQNEKFSIYVLQSHGGRARREVSEFFSLHCASNRFLCRPNFALDVREDYQGRPNNASDKWLASKPAGKDGRATQGTEERKDTIESSIEAFIQFVETNPIGHVYFRFVVGTAVAYGLVLGGVHRSILMVSVPSAAGAAASGYALGESGFFFPWSVPCEQFGGVGANILSQDDSTAHIESEDVAEVHIPGDTTTPPAPGAVWIGSGDA